MKLSRKYDVSSVNNKQDAATYNKDKFLNITQEIISI